MITIPEIIKEEIMEMINFELKIAMGNYDLSLQNPSLNKDYLKGVRDGIIIVKEKVKEV